MAFTRVDAAGLVTGLILAWNGLLVLFVPALLIYAYRRRTLLRTGLLLVLGFLVGMLPFFPASLSGWVYRAGRTSAAVPFWWSFWRLLPARWYQPNFDRLLVLAVGIAGTLGYAWRRLTIRDALLAAVGGVMLTGVYQNPARVVPVLLLIFALTPRVPFRWMAVFCLLMLVYYPLDRISNADIHRWQLVAFWLPVAYTIGLYVRYRAVPQADD